ncbi:hypothetical protein [Actinoplanes utahensis]|uniref:hypothetical protein n=1 Tax=Actinoplanes utahensis TaxID=1869 RepID=UPI00068E5B1F|nr:hypothetical protein [Actinoplanes utahensis]GIF32632.1 hypothetical protein Aut01nite_56180 [Actinoplanes utahensis]
MTVRVETAQRPGSPDEPAHARTVVLDDAAIVLDGPRTGGAPRLLPGPLTDFARTAGPTVAVCRWTDEVIEVLVMGTATAFVSHRDGGVHIARGGRPAAVRSWPREDIDAVLLMNDGVAAVTERFSRAGFPHERDILELVATGGVQALVDHVHAVEDTDPRRLRRPRERRHDDKAAALVMTETFVPGSRYQLPYSTLTAAYRALERHDFETAAGLFRSVARDTEHAPRDDEDLCHAHSAAGNGYATALAGAGRLDELTALAADHRFARRQLDVRLYADGRAADLRQRALAGDLLALFMLIRLLRMRGDDDAARRAAEQIAPGNERARQILAEPRSSLPTEPEYDRFREQF